MVSYRPKSSSSVLRTFNVAIPSVLSRPFHTANIAHTLSRESANVKLVKDSIDQTHQQPVTSSPQPTRIVCSRKPAPRSHVLDYIGQVHDQTTASQTSDYILSFDRVTGLSVDAAMAGNEGRFINDFRGGVADRPNVEFEPYRDERTGEVRMGVWVLQKAIRKGEELCISYGKGFWKERGLI